MVFRGNLLVTLTAVCLLILPFMGGGAVSAQEVEKEQIPEEHLDKSLKQLPWGAAVWDADEAVAALENEEKILWVDTRPSSYFEKGSIQGAVMLPYEKQDKDKVEGFNDMTSEKLEDALSKAGATKDSVKVVFFCQGPKCHRSYNASYITITQWGYSPENIVWFREGFPGLLKKLQDDPKLKRKAKNYLDEMAYKSM